ncbi:hypothetical protein FOZ60_012941 [Perkinsus olseni]|uniref:Tyr recombinase domain-containing protein n=1 Tax=Perkinsus olseni TaxID=32597 RepID=A0A7J6P9B5_PEROL|nr:hypothetical protein FOZ60_012941 [Perkinsus olseni]
MPKKSQLPSHLLEFYAAEAAATPEDRARANSRLLESSLKPRTMASYQTPLRFYEMGFGSREITSGTVRKYTSAVRTMGMVRTGTSIPPEGEALISRALASADRILLDKDKPKKQAAPLCQECLQSLADMQLTPGGLRDQLRSAVLVASIFMLRFDQLPGLIRADISWESSSEGLLVSVIFHDTKTASREERQTLCTEGIFCRRTWCIAHYLVSACRTRADGGDERIFPSLKSATFGKELRAFLSAEFPSKVLSWDIPNITGHSMRRSGACALLANNVPAEQVRVAGNWRSRAWEEYGLPEIKRQCRGHAAEILGSPA